MAESVRILLLDDAPVDAESILGQLGELGLALVTLRVDNEASYRAALKDFAPDVIVADVDPSSYDTTRALELARELTPYAPLIFVTRPLGEETAVDLVKAGAADLVLRGSWARLGEAVRTALARSRAAADRDRSERELRKSEQQFQDLFEIALDIIFSI